MCFPTQKLRSHFFEEFAILSDFNAFQSVCEKPIRNPLFPYFRHQGSNIAALACHIKSMCFYMARMCRTCSVLTFSPQRGASFDHPRGAARQAGQITKNENHGDHGFLMLFFEDLPRQTPHLETCLAWNGKRVD